MVAHSDLLLLGTERFLKVFMFLQQGLYAVQRVTQVLIQEESLTEGQSSSHASIRKTWRKSLRVRLQSTDVTECKRGSVLLREARKTHTPPACSSSCRPAQCPCRKAAGPCTVHTAVCAAPTAPAETLSPLPECPATHTKIKGYIHTSITILT